MWEHRPLCSPGFSAQGPSRKWQLRQRSRWIVGETPPLHLPRNAVYDRYLFRRPPSVSCRCPVIRTGPDVVLRMRDPHQPFVEPTNNVIETLDAVPGFS